MDPSNTSEPQDFVAIENVYSLLARLWIRELDLPLIEQLTADPSFREAFQAVGGSLPEVSLVEDLAAEYCQFFIGPKEHLPPFQSVWLEGRLQSDVTDSIEGIMDVVRFDRQRIPEGTMVDHLGVLMLVMSAIVAQLGGEDAKQNESHEIATVFFQRHLTWADPLLRNASRREGSSFYSALAKMTLDFLTSQRDMLLSSG